MVDDATKREASYNNDMAKYLVELHDSKATFDFCGGMLFQLVLSDALRSHLAKVAKDGAKDEQPVVFAAAVNRMAKIPGYSQSAHADNLRVFHGREVRRVPNAAGGMGFVLHLSAADGGDSEGWTSEELASYDGWGHDSQRDWRTGARLESEGFTSFTSKFGGEAFTLHHRFYLRLDQRRRLWLSAEDGCEGTPVL